MRQREAELRDLECDARERFNDAVGKAARDVVKERGWSDDYVAKGMTAEEYEGLLEEARRRVGPEALADLIDSLLDIEVNWELEAAGRWYRRKAGAARRRAGAGS
jgi:hypothetical protein